MHALTYSQNTETHIHTNMAFGPKTFLVVKHFGGHIFWSKIRCNVAIFLVKNISFEIIF
jgi:hypothetical protein